MDREDLVVAHIDYC